MSVNLNTFEKDRLFRDVKGVPLGRIVMFDESLYEPGMESIMVAVLKIPYSEELSVSNLEGFVDGYKYRIPTTVHDIKVNRRDRDWVISNFFLRRVYE